MKLHTGYAARHGMVRTASLFALALLCPTAVMADAGIPMVAIAYPAILLLLIPVIAVESIYLRFRLRTPWGNTVAATAGANLITMLLGFPLAWLISLLLEFAFFGFLRWTGIPKHVQFAPGKHVTELLAAVLTAPWLGPGFEDRWPILIAFTVLLIPAFFLSGCIEAHLLGRRGWLRYGEHSARYVWRANALSYAFLAFAGCVLIWHQLG